MAAEAGRVSAQYALGGFYYDGLGVAVRKVDAYAWWLVSAANGNRTAKDKWEKVRGELNRKR